MPIFHPENSKVFEELLKQLYKLAGSSDYIRDMRINESLSTLLTLLMQESWNPDNSAISKKRMELVSVKNYMDEHYVEKITLDDLEAQFFINKYYMCHTFKKQTGITIKEFMNTRKITKAKQMISEGADIMGLCYECGFNDYSTFYKAFKKLTGKSPKDFLTGD